jgi:hypothetical protein
MVNHLRNGKNWSGIKSESDYQRPTLTTQETTESLRRICQGTIILFPPLHFLAEFSCQIQQTSEAKDLKAEF